MPTSLVFGSIVPTQLTHRSTQIINPTNDPKTARRQFMLEMIKVPKREQRLQGMLYKQLLQGRQEDMRSMAGLINSACLDVRLSRRLKKLLGIILKLGNQLNEVCYLTSYHIHTYGCDGFRVLPVLA